MVLLFLGRHPTAQRDENGLGRRIAIVTGASPGIGAAIAERLAGDGVAVVVNYAGDVASAEALVASIERTGGRVISVKADVSDADAVRRLFDNAESACFPRPASASIISQTMRLLCQVDHARRQRSVTDRQSAINSGSTTPSGFGRP